MELLIDASLPDLRLALAEGGRAVAGEVERRGKAESLETLLERALERCSRPLSDVDVVAALRGPGSFTGLRVALAFAQGLAFGRPGIRLLTADTFALLGAVAAAKGASGPGAVLLPARRGFLYAATAVVEPGSRSLPEVSRRRMVAESEVSAVAAEGGWTILPDDAPCRAALPGALAFGSDELLLDALLPCLSDLAQVDPAVGISPEYVEPPQAKPGAAKGLAAC